jgi:hypothetical protein
MRLATSTQDAAWRRYSSALSRCSMSGLSMN